MWLFSFDPWPQFLRPKSADGDHEGHRNPDSGVCSKTSIWRCELWACNSYRNSFISLLQHITPPSPHLKNFRNWNSNRGEICVRAAFNVLTPFLRPEAMSRASRKWRKKTSTVCFPQLIHKVRWWLDSPIDRIYPFDSRTERFQFPRFHSFVSRGRAGAHVAAGSGEQGKRWGGAHAALLHWIQRTGGGDGTAAVRPLVRQHGPVLGPVET